MQSRAVAMEGLGERKVVIKRTNYRLDKRRSPSPRRLGLLFILPWLIGFMVFTLYPFMASLYFSFTSYDLTTAPHWVGLANYSRLFQSHEFYQSLYNTFYYTIIEVPLSTLSAIGIALLLNMEARGRSIYRTLFYVPSIVPTLASSVLWIWIFNPSFGILNSVLGDIGLPGTGWIFSTVWSKPSLIIMGLWGMGAPIVIYLASLKGIPQDLYEAASVAGAGAWRKVRSITIPMLTPVIFFNIVLGVITSLQYFTQAYVMTRGGPNQSTEFIGLYIYQEAFGYLNFGYSSCIAWMLFILILIATFLLFRSSKRWVFYGGSEF